MKKVRRKKYRWGRIFCLFMIIILGICSIYVYLNHYFEKEKKKEQQDSKSHLVDKVEETEKVMEKVPSNHQEFMGLADGDYLTEKGYTLTIKDHIAYIDDLIIVNKTYSLPSEYVPVHPYHSISGDKCNDCINQDAMESFLLMQSDAKAIGLHIYISSGYRSYHYQENLYQRYVSRSGQALADTYSARAGHSEHQSGTCFDLNTIDDSFANTEEGQWVNSHAYLYGFVIRYPKGKESLTGYQYESWHLRYVGKELASKLYQDGNWLTLEEYYGISSSY